MFEVYSFYTNLDIEECKNRISNIVRTNRYSSGQIQGKVNIHNNTFHLFKTSSIEVVRDTYLKMFYGNMAKAEHGTTIKGSFHIQTFGKIFLAFWFGGLTLMYAVMISTFISNSFSGETNMSSALWMLLVPPAMFLVGAFLVKFKFLFSSDDKKHILEFIKTTLEAEETNSSN